ncbi:hypothetical protein PM10SUCC1_00350 [Propionigenium maris DSM 9537]|uniref:Uncharacterized protein n=1 Tax=Propionigenium maris DSM 9537 TaxID=1123000 RepID=A0A9W6GHZ7_9FUSO|nr:hypothetical protein [Propionigenium maris]GLI54520.1 hypothetical protein PM10SUCC1_00350 [Propionigenium maris DSM 9537]
MDIEKLLEGEADKYLERNGIPNKEFLDLESEFLESIGGNKLFYTYDSLRGQEELKAVEEAYFEGLKTGLKLLNTIIDLGKLEVEQLKEVANGKRAS